jgi:CxxC motif-containing protein (DUF1111 family)
MRLLACLVIVVAACDRGPTPPEPPEAPDFNFATVAALGDPISGITSAELELFRRGRAVFTRTFTPQTGVGPLFNDVGCVVCHDNPAVGGNGTQVEVHTSAFVDGRCDELFGRGGPVIQTQVTPALHAALGITSDPVPPAATGTARRTAPDIFGFGLLDAVPDAAILRRADPNDENGDGISGRVNRFFDGRIGRFGRKAQVPTLSLFNDEAFLLEMSVTTPSFPQEEGVLGQPLPPGVDPAPDPEIDQRSVDEVNAFAALLAPPQALPLSFEAGVGAVIFVGIGCADCHTPALVTGSSSPFPSLRNRVVPAFTDMLLHDMGPELADICILQATPSEFRTEPLMGLRFATRFLHDGRASSIAQAITLHGGEAARSRDRFRNLSSFGRSALLEFLRSL